MKINSDNGVSFETHSDPKMGFTLWLSGFDACRHNKCSVRDYQPHNRTLYVILDTPHKPLPRGKSGGRMDTLVHLEISLASVEESYGAHISPETCDFSKIRVGVEADTGKLRLDFPR